MAHQVNGTKVQYIGMRGRGSANGAVHGGADRTRNLLVAENDRHAQNAVKLSFSVMTTTMAPDNVGSYPGQSFSLSQLLYATKRKLRDATLGERYARNYITLPVISQTQTLLRTVTTLIQPEVR